VFLKIVFSISVAIGLVFDDFPWYLSCFPSRFFNSIVRRSILFNFFSGEKPAYIFYAHYEFRIYLLLSEIHFAFPICCPHFTQYRLSTFFSGGRRYRYTFEYEGRKIRLPILPFSFLVTQIKITKEVIQLLVKFQTGAATMRHGVSLKN